MNQMAPFAAPPEGWPEAPTVSVLDFLWLVLLIPLAVIAVITLLVYLPSMVRGRSSEPSVAFAERSEWFGGPRKGVEGVQRQPVDASAQAPGQGAVDDEQRGGASARW